MALLKVDGVTAGYGDAEILRGVSIEVREGEVVSIIGPNGAGKSTLMKTIFGLLHPRRGAVVLGDQDISRLSPSQIVGLGMRPEERRVGKEGVRRGRSRWWP